VDVIPVADPNASTMAQKVVQYQAVMQMAQANPQIYDLPELNKQMLEVLGIKNIGKLIPAAEEEKPRDPVSENQAVLNGKPVKAFLYQDHKAHITVHTSAMQDPQIMKLVGQSPMAQQIQASMEAHIAEHLGYEYRKQIEEQLGVPLPEEDEVIPKDVEVEVSRLVAQAAQQLLAKHQSEAQQEEAQQQQQDPIVQMQQKELELKEQEIQAKGMKMQAEDANEKERLAIDRERIASAERIAQLNVEAKLQLEDKKLDTDQMIQGVKIGAEYSHKNKQLDADLERSGVDMGMKATQKQQDLAMRRAQMEESRVARNKQPQQPKEE
jgi:hypothetical protein